ncbi:complement C1q tumor necrosis factor-related protein 3-like [Liolophura sinensis]|uniref:complement C1q tumor necrosis factor-related protein 3-like n=1 Tax=Liolophura sinensis TaxID=3198878 RepID=UPI003159202C
MFRTNVLRMCTLLVSVVILFVSASSSHEWAPHGEEDLSPPHEEESLEKKAASLVDKLSASCDATHVLARLILQETAERVKLQEQVRLQMTGQENVTKMQEKLRKALADLTAKAQEKEPLVAFTARVKSHLSNLQDSQTIVFGTVETNLGNAYNPHTGIFTCPVNGVYQFFVSILSWPKKRIETHLAVNGEGRLLVYSSSSAMHHGSLGTGTIILELNEEDKVQVKLTRNFGDYIHCCWSTFSGHLLRAT